MSSSTYPPPPPPSEHLQEDLESYLAEKGVHALFLRIVEALLVDRPDDVPEFLIRFLIDKYPQQAQKILAATTTTTPVTTTTTTSKKTKDTSNKRPPPPQQPQQNTSSITTDAGDSMMSSEDIVDDTLRPTSPPPPKLASQQQENRRGSISAAPITAEEAALPPVVFPKSVEDKTAITNMLRNNWLTSSIDAEQSRRIVDAMQPVEFQPGETIIKQGDEFGDAYYVVKSGVAHVVNEQGTILRVCQAGDGFGELALLYNTPRCATVVAAATTTPTPPQSVHLWSLDRITFKVTLIASVMARRERHREFLSRIPLFKSLSGKERLVVADALQVVHFSQGSTIVEQGTRGDSFFLMSKGKVNVFHNGEMVDKLSGEGIYFGEIALLSSDGLRATTIVAVEDVEAFKLRREVFYRVLGAPVLDRLRKSMQEYKRSGGGGGGGGSSGSKKKKKGGGGGGGGTGE